MPLLGAYGRALADAGDYNQALDVLGRAHTPDNPDWRILNAQGAVLDQLGRHAEAQRHYSAALRIVPGEPSVLSNLGLSYALTKDLKLAESTLRQAVARPDAAPKVRQNLALVVGLQGRFAEAEKIARADLPPDQAAANVGYLRQMLAQRGDWTKKGRPPFVPVPDAGT
jgi:Flp pilus assembly protein TadD